MKQISVMIESKFHHTQATLKIRVTAKQEREVVFIIKGRAMRRAIQKCCPSHYTGQCRCPITPVGDYEILGPDSNGDWQLTY